MTEELHDYPPTEAIPCPFCDFDDCYVSEREDVVVCPACGAQGPTEWKRFGDTEIDPLEMWQRRAQQEAVSAALEQIAQRLLAHGDGLIFTGTAAAIVREGITANAPNQGLAPQEETNAK